MFGKAKGGGKKAGVNFRNLDYRIQLCTAYTNDWRQFFDFFGEGFEGRRITQQEEEKFHVLLVDLANKHYVYTELINNHLEPKYKKAIFDILCDCISLSHVKNLSVSEYSRLIQRWHEVFIYMNKALGILVSQKAEIEANQKTKESMKKHPKKAPESGKE